ncbi:PAS domain-containing protein (plasmid) [Ensifer adhaerens]|uniref:PAS domain-containing protein n=1 Tax=Ensifer adhaerens TaxID=106592 RepID=UPI0023A9C576|nr:PAS domain-containing protein [Ensifer adhaerens]WDZ79340.1 PAS domain-containing protein [Ensifer adhaerens]
MIPAWSDRPGPQYLGLFVAAYFAAAGFAQLLAIVPGTGISIWPPSGLFIATLVYSHTLNRPWWIIAGLLAELLANALWFHNPLPAAMLIYTGNALEAAAGAWLIRRTCGWPVRMESVQDVLAIVVMGAGLAPLISATVGSATLAWFNMQAFATAWPLWWIGDATGVLIVAPLALVLFQSWRGEAPLSATRWLEAFVLGLIFLGVAGLSLSGYLAFAYIIMPPLLWAAVRFEFKGAVVALALLALVTAAFTLSGVSQFAGDPDSQRHKQVMLQLFLVISAFSALIVAAISRQYHLAAQTLRQSERSLRQLIDTVPALLWRLAADGEPTFFNKHMVDFVGQEVVNFDTSGMSRLAAFTRMLVHPEDQERVSEAFNTSLASGERLSLRYRVRRADGGYRWIESRAEPMRDADGRIIQWYGVSVDTDDEVRAQEALRSRERELSQLVDMVPGLLWRLDPTGEPVFFSRRMIDFFGLDAGQQGLLDPSWLASFMQTIIHPDDAHRLGEALRHCYATGESFAMRYRLRRADGAYRWVSGRAEPLRDDNGQVLQWYGLAHDIHDQVQAEEALRRNERQLQQIIDAVPANIWSWTPEGEMSYVSKRYLDYLGLAEAKPDDFAGVAQQLVHADDAPEVQRTAAVCLKTGEAFTMRYRRREKDGTYRWMEGRCEPLRDRDGTIVQWYGVSLDIDDQVRSREELSLAQENLVRASQAASLAELSASIAHEVGQPLTALASSADACQRWLSAQPPNLDRARLALERIISSTRSAAEVVSRVRALFRHSEASRSPTELGRLLSEARDLMAEDASRRRVHMEVDVGSDIPSLVCDRVQIQQVLINLIRNGMEAMDAVSGKRVLKVQARSAGSEILVEIRDRGPGIEFPDKIFEPFFTTKGQGMGMGLAICRSIVESHGGRLWAEKGEPEGTKFTFTLPTGSSAGL